MKQTIYILTITIGLFSCNNQPKNADGKFIDRTDTLNNQANSKFIFFYKPYTDSSETNLYRDIEIKFDFKTQYENIKNADVEKDVEFAIQHKDYRIVGISGNTYLYPGLEGGYKTNSDGTKVFNGLAPKFEDYIKEKGFKVIEGTSDAINLNDPDLQSVAYKYAKKYNLLLLEKMNMRK